MYIFVVHPFPFRKSLRSVLVAYRFYTNVCKTKLAMQDKLRSPMVIIFIFSGVRGIIGKNGQFMEYHIHISNIFSAQCPSISVRFDLCTFTVPSSHHTQAIHNMSLANEIHFARIYFAYLLLPPYPHPLAYTQCLSPTLYIILFLFPSHSFQIISSSLFSNTHKKKQDCSVDQ